MKRYEIIRANHTIGTSRMDMITADEAIEMVYEYVTHARKEWTTEEILFTFDEQEAWDKFSTLKSSAELFRRNKHYEWDIDIYQLEVWEGEINNDGEFESDERIKAEFAPFDIINHFWEEQQKDDKIKEMARELCDYTFDTFESWTEEKADNAYKQADLYINDYAKKLNNDKEWNLDINNLNNIINAAKKIWHNEYA